MSIKYQYEYRTDLNYFIISMSEADSTQDRPAELTQPSIKEKQADEKEFNHFPLNGAWCFGLNKEVGVLNVSPNDSKKQIFYAAGHTGIMYDFIKNTQSLLQGHTNNISCIAASGNKRWIVMGDTGKDNMISIWDATTATPIRYIFDVGGVNSLAISNDARYVAIITSMNEFKVWDWTAENDKPVHQQEIEATEQNQLVFNPMNSFELMSNSSDEAIFYHFNEKTLTVHAPDLPEKDFNRNIGNFSQGVFMPNSSDALAASNDGTVTVFTKISRSEIPAIKKVSKIVKLIDAPITIMETLDNLIGIGSSDGSVRFYDQQLRLRNWYGTFDAGAILSLSYAGGSAAETLTLEVDETIPTESSLEASPFVICDFTVCTEQSIVCNVKARTNNVDIILKEHNDHIKAIATHPSLPHVAIGSYCGLLKIWNYQDKTQFFTRAFGMGREITALAYDHIGEFIAVGFYHGTILVLDSVTLEIIEGGKLSYAKALITQLSFSHDNMFLGAIDTQNTTTLFKRSNNPEKRWGYIGRYRAHYKPIVKLLFGVALDSNVPRLITLGSDRNLVEYDLLNSTEDNLVILSTDKIEQSAVPVSCAWYPPINKEHFLLIANTEYKYKLYNATTKRCRQTLLGPTHGSFIQKLVNISFAEKQQHVGFITNHKVGITALPLDGNPHNSTALLGHCDGINNVVVSYDSKFLFTVGGKICRMWKIAPDVLHATAALGGKDLEPFYQLLPGGRDGPLFKEMEDYFYYAQIRSQSITMTGKRKVGKMLALDQVPNIMRALGFYPTELQIQDMINEIKFSKYVETNEIVTELDIGTLLKLYCNHRPVFGLPLYKVYDAFQQLAGADKNGRLDRGLLLTLLQSRGEHISESELAEFLASLLELSGSATNKEDKMNAIAPGEEAATLESLLPLDIDADMFSGYVLGFQPVNQ